RILQPMAARKWRSSRRKVSLSISLRTASPPLKACRRAPEEIRTPDPQIRSLVLSSARSLASISGLAGQVGLVELPRNRSWPYKPRWQFVAGQPPTPGSRPSQASLRLQRRSPRGQRTLVLGLLLGSEPA